MSDCKAHPETGMTCNCKQGEQLGPVRGFATYKPYPKGLMADVFVGGNQYAYETVQQAKKQIEIINSAHSAAIKKSVDEAESRGRVRGLEEAKLATCIGCREGWKMGKGDFHFHPELDPRTATMRCTSHAIRALIQEAKK